MFYIISPDLVHTARHVTVIIFSCAFYTYFTPVSCISMRILIRIVWFMGRRDVSTVEVIAPPLYR